ncbi:hypothetical protein SAMN03159341_11682 [Paenibacillus sp. 1_12]|nr:hypothetical protein [Paenibacillus sp. 1_12]SFM09917.1 hypothetical protein SAMN03159341_11682 [Paenibacillus sp. 1_12]
MKQWKWFEKACIVLLPFSDAGLLHGGSVYAAGQATGVTEVSFRDFLEN